MRNRLLTLTSTITAMLPVMCQAQPNHKSLDFLCEMNFCITDSHGQKVGIINPYEYSGFAIRPIGGVGWALQYANQVINGKLTGSIGLGAGLYFPGPNCTGQPYLYTGYFVGPNDTQPYGFSYPSVAAYDGRIIWVAQASSLPNSLSFNSVKSDSGCYNETGMIVAQPAVVGETITFYPPFNPPQ